MIIITFFLKQDIHVQHAEMEEWVTTDFSLLVNVSSDVNVCAGMSLLFPKPSHL